MFLYNGNDILGTVEESDASLTILADGADELGAQVAFIGDLDGDGFDEFLVSAPAMDGGGQVGIFRGSAALSGNLTFSDADLVIAGIADGQRFGDRVTSIGDRGQDGLPELMIGAPGADSGAGRVYLFTSAHLAEALFSAGDLLAGDADMIFIGESPGDRLNTVGDIGDIDLDGIPDLAVGAPNEFVDPYANAGRLYLYLTGP